jgi:hypothetical protein
MSAPVLFGFWVHHLVQSCLLLRSHFIVTNSESYLPGEYQQAKVVRKSYHYSKPIYVIEPGSHGLFGAKGIL